MTDEERRQKRIDEIKNKIARIQFGDDFEGLSVAVGELERLNAELFYLLVPIKNV